jgi:ABC-type polysaccharide/polyol phosphate transport system ATPase subunit
LPTSADGTVIVENAWKRFRADRAKPRLTDQMAKLRRRMRGEGRGYRWVLKDINFEVQPGQTLGLIGVNGSGKSTLLKCISHCMWQTAGRVETHGRIGAILEVRGGIQPVLSGRENIFMFGSILGLTRRQIEKRVDTIVEFAEVEDAIDRQVKYYSSGMQVRLGFSIASHLDAEILLVDEVLAVGDANFQQKCLAHISDVVASGVSLLFVSHDLAAVEAVCERTVWLNDSVAMASGPTREVLGRYRESIEAHAALAAASSTSELRVLKVEMTGPDGEAATSGQDLFVRMVLSVPVAGEARFAVGVSEGTAVPIFVTKHRAAFPVGEFEMKIRIRDIPLPRGRFYLWLAVEQSTTERATQAWKPVGYFDVFGPPAVQPPKGVMVLSSVFVHSDWELS